MIVSPLPWLIAVYHACAIVFPFLACRQCSVAPIAEVTSSNQGEDA